MKITKNFWRSYNVTKTTIEEATRILDQNRHLKPVYLKRYRAIKDGNLQEYFLRELQNFRNYSDTPPPDLPYLLDEQEISRVVLLGKNRERMKIQKI